MSPDMTNRRWYTTWLLVTVLTVASSPRPGCAERPLDTDWNANAVVDDVVAISDPSLGAAQGASYRDNHLYFYGDVYQANPRVGIIREYTLNLKPTGHDAAANGCRPEYVTLKGRRLLATADYGDGCPRGAALRSGAARGGRALLAIGRNATGSPFNVTRNWWNQNNGPSPHPVNEEIGTYRVPAVPRQGA
jgi:hypothetical protein